MPGRNIAVVLAGGVGKRLGMSTPKQFYKVAGKMVVEHTIDAFEKHPAIDEIAIVANPMLIADFESIVLRNAWTKVRRILKGGQERYHSSLSAIEAYRNEDVNLIFHDAVRPLLSQQLISNVVDALRSHPAVDVAIPSADTLIEVEGEHICSIPDRARYRRGQTPQAFHIDVIARAYDAAMSDSDLRVTDDCGVVMRYMPQVPIYVVTGEETNIKLTYKEDTYMLDKFFQLRHTTLPAAPPDAGQMEGKVAVVFGGSYGIGDQTATHLRLLGAHVHCFSRTMGGVNIADRSSVADALRQVAEREGCIHYIINTAGVLHREPLATMDPETVTGDIGINYLGAVNVAMEGYRYLKATRGVLLLFTSSSYTRGRAFYSIYSSTKAAIVNFVQAVAQEWETDGIRVNCINPERTKTPMRLRNFGIEPDESLLTAEAVAEATVSALAAQFTGQVVDVRRKP